MALLRRGKTGRYSLVLYQHGKHLYRALGTSDKKVAEYKAAQLTQQFLADGLPPALQTITLRRALLAYWHETRVRLRPRSARHTVRRLLRGFRRTHATTLKAMTAPLLTTLVTAWSGSEAWSPKTYRNVHGELSSFFGWCVRQGWLTESPMRRVPRRAVPQREIRFLTDAEIQRLLDAIHGTRWYLPVVTAIYTGLRLGELKALDWSDIDCERRELTVRNKPHFTTKTGSWRIVPLSEGLRSILRSAAHARGPCFPDGQHKTDFGWWEARRRLGLPAHWTFTCFRHTFATHHAIGREGQPGADPRWLKEVMGHTSIATTDRYYIGRRPGSHHQANRFAPPLVSISVSNPTGDH